MPAIYMAIGAMIAVASVKATAAEPAWLFLFFPAIGFLIFVANEQAGKS